jgi:hypothetical protein
VVHFVASSANNKNLIKMFPKNTISEAFFLVMQLAFVSEFANGFEALLGHLRL